MTKLLVEIVGWYGAIAIMLAYGLVSFGILDAKTVTYQLLNVTGAVGIVVVSMTKNAYQPAALNVVWTVIGVVALMGILL